MYANVINVYRAVSQLANKDQRGFVTIDEFNTFANQAQLLIFNNLFREFEDYRRSSRQSINASREKSRRKLLEEDLGFFSKAETLTKENGLFSKPNNVSRIISISTAGGVLMGNMTRTPIDVTYNEDDVERILASDLSKPTASSPLAMVREKIQVYPSSVNKIRVKYYKRPESSDLEKGTAGPVAYSTGSGVRHFELPSHYENELVIEIAKMVGLNIRDTDVVNYTMAEQQPKIRE